MRAYTPYTFIDYFLRKIIDDDDDQQAFERLIQRAIKLILTTIKGLNLSKSLFYMNLIYTYIHTLVQKKKKRKKEEFQKFILMQSWVVGIECRY